MKKILLVGIMFLMFAGVVSASNINGNYKGNPIVKLLNNGVEVAADDTPAMIYDNRTMVPINLLKKLGVTVTWDLDKYSVDVQIPSSKSGIDDVKILKIYSRIAEQYKRMGGLGDLISGLSDSFALTYTAITTNYNPDQSIDNSLKNLNNAIEGYNTFANPNMDVIKMANGIGLDVSDINYILSGCSTAIDQYKKAYVSLENFYRNKKTSDGQDYLSYNQNGFDTLKIPRTSAMTKYFEFYNKLQNY